VATAPPEPELPEPELPEPELPEFELPEFELPELELPELELPELEDPELEDPELEVGVELELIPLELDEEDEPELAEADAEGELELAEADTEGELVAVWWTSVAAVWVDPGSTKATAPAAATLATLTAVVVERTLARPRSLAATACRMPSRCALLIVLILRSGTRNHL
jgi:hypothetical protein